jgi:hypothetical protein
MLGRQELYADAQWINDYGQRMLGGEPYQRQADEKYSESFFKWLGAQSVESMDFSDYENATLIHDLNTPLPDVFKNRFTTLFDGGTLEHVFNFPTAIRSCIDMLRVGGYFLSITPANNQMGHGFYQFSPELYYSLFTGNSGFEIKAVWLGVERGAGDWIVYDVTNPSTIGERVIFTNANPTHLMVIAKKIAVVGSLITVHQSDYKSVWEEVSNEGEVGGIKNIYRKVVPKVIRDMIWKYRFQNANRTNLEGLGNVSSRHFKKIEF